MYYDVNKRFAKLKPVPKLQVLNLDVSFDNDSIINDESNDEKIDENDIEIKNE